SARRRRGGPLRAERGQRGGGRRIPRARDPLHRHRLGHRGCDARDRRSRGGHGDRGGLRNRRRGALARARAALEVHRMNTIQTIVAFLAALTLLIFVHELRHYLVARWCGVKVLRFSIGFGRPLLRWRAKPDAIEWVIASIPLGGYV